MNTFKEKIGNIEFILLIIVILIGERLISLPRVAVTTAGYGALTSVFIGGILITLIGNLFVGLSKFSSEKTIFEKVELIIGWIPAKVLTIFLFIYFFSFAAIFARRIAEFSKSILLFNTPTEIIIICFLMISGYCAAKGVQNYAKTTAVLATISFCVIIAAFLVSAFHLNIAELQPAIQIDSIKKIDILNLGLPTYIGLELFLFFTPFLKKSYDIRKNLNIALITASIYFVLSIGFSIGLLGETSLYYEYYPGFQVAKVISFDPYIDLRGDISFATFWFLIVYLVMVGYHYVSSFTLSNILKLKSHSVFVVLLIPLFFIVSLVPQNLGEMDNVLRLLEKVWLYGIIGSLLFVYIFGLLTKKIKA